MKSSSRLFLTIAAGLALVAALVWALLPEPISVDLVKVRVAPMEVTVSAEGVTRVREPWEVIAPVTGNTTRSPVEVGDKVEKGKTVVAVIQPAEPAFLDARARRLAEASVTEALASVQLAEVNLDRAEIELDHYETELSRNTTLADRGVLSVHMLENTQQQVATATAARDGARFELALQRATLARMEAQLAGPEQGVPDGEVSQCCIEIKAPGSGTVLKVADVNARMVQAGGPLVSIGDLAALEIEVDLLSTDAVRIFEGAQAYVDRWGGTNTIDAMVRRIDPSAFTQVSALGIEEQRVKLTLDILTPPEGRVGLGDHYRVFVKIVVWSQDDVLQVPQSALFRQDGSWALFLEEEERAVLRLVKVGQRTGDWAQILDGVAAGEHVLAYPSSQVEDGTKLLARNPEGAAE